MAQQSVADFARELKVPPSALLQQLRAAGVNKQAAEDPISEQDKAKLLEYLRKAHGTAGKIDLKRITPSVPSTTRSSCTRTTQDSTSR